MLRELEKISTSSNQGLTDDELRSAAARLREKQFIFKDKRGQSRTFDVLVSQKNYFTDLFDAFGDEFFVDNHFGYCGIIPHSSRPMLKQIETIFLLILAKMHDLECRKARSENGRTQPSEAVFLDEYCQVTGREKPKQAETRLALERLSRLSVIELGDINELTDMREITILPSIMRVVSGGYLDLLSAFCTEETAKEAAEETKEAELVSELNIPTEAPSGKANENSPQKKDDIAQEGNK